MSDYAKLKVTELKELLEKRGLATTGKKDDLISRLTAADAEAAAASEPTVDPHLAPPEDEFDWEGLEEDTTKGGAKKDTAAGQDAPAPAAAPATDPTAAAPVSAEPEQQTAATDKKKFAFHRIADEFNEPEPTKDTKTGDDDKIAAPAADGATIEAGAEQPKEPEYSAHLASTKVDDELAKRKARAARFGITVDDSVKLLERGLRFNSNTTEGGSDSAEGSKLVKGLDQALGEGNQGGRGRKRGPGGHDNNRGGSNNDRDRKRSRGNDGGNQRRQQQQSNPQKQQQQQNAPRGILTDPTEKAKAEARAKRFG